MLDAYLICMSKHIHIVGIAGVGTSALAVALHNAGYKVTGSDKGFFPPVSTALEKSHIEFYPGFHPEKMGTPEIVIAGGSGTSDQNPEFIHAKENKIQVMSLAEAVGKFVVKKHSVVTAGTWGKTSSAALLSYILSEAGYDPSYFFGGLSLSHPNGKISESNWSVVEGDEYQSAIWDKNPKFHYYNPTHLLLTSVAWDHADLYPTEESYFRVFERLISKVDFIVACKDSDGVRKTTGDKKVIWYGKLEDGDEAKMHPIASKTRHFPSKEGKMDTPMPDYVYSGVKQTKDGLDFMINGTRILSPLLGTFQAENITACYTLARELGIQEETIVKSISEFQGLKRRMEKRHENKVAIIDDIAHSADKVRHTLAELKNIYDGKIIAIFEPNTGGRKKASVASYENCFKDADMVIIPRLTKLKRNNAETKDEFIEGEKLAEIIGNFHKNTKYMGNDDELVSYAVETSKPGDCIVFLGSHGFRGMIEETVEEISGI